MNSDEESVRAVLRLIARTILLAWFSVAGLTASLSVIAPSFCRIIGAIVGIACGSVLFIQMVRVQIARHCLAGNPGSLAS